MARTAVVTGDAEVNRRLAALKGPLAKKAIRKSSREALRPVADDARTLAPRKSGRLRRSIGVRALKRSRSRVGARVTTGAESRQFKGRTYYGGWIEYGRKAGRRVRNADLGAARGTRRSAAQQQQAKSLDRSRRRIPGARFMRRAARRKRGAALTIYRQRTRHWIHELATR